MTGRNEGGPRPYDFEPILARPRSPNAGHNVMPPVPRNEIDEERNRLLNMNWCSCGLCVFMPTEKECTCCNEVDNCREKLNSNSCITELPDFHNVCLDKTVLRTAIVMVRYARGLTNAQDHYDKKTYRYAAYRSFTAWIHGALGKRQRRVIPACAVSAIRSAYPAEDGIYQGFLEAQGEVEDALLL
ncbi:hypothetical protein BSL78_24567 [Apostichopus japonicus]|uniref:P2X purinoreceptor 7 intracellular domain-containing protein n=1 Tax=Stichopus japonicus TaxID=307972 RepID=A0A2G8JSD3_STIJA|nr:hypothetical protein BSL78_24567 [Apostichopus japonicus]